jgi:hypothetical protein
MPEIFVAQDDLAVFLDASRPAILVGGGLLKAIRSFEKQSWRAFAVFVDAPGDMRIARDTHADKWERIPSLPTHVLAILLAADSIDRGLPSPVSFAPAILPVVLIVENAERVLAELSDVLAREIAANAEDLIQGRAALSEMRRENETLQSVIASTLQVLGGWPVGVARLAFASGFAADGPVYAAPEGRALARQTLGLPLKNLTAIRLNVATARCSDRSWLKVRLQAADTGVVHGSWLINGDVLRTGWLTLDLRFVLGDFLETAQIEIESCLSEGEALGLSLDRAEVEPSFALQGDCQGLGRHALSLRALGGEFGRRTLTPQYWNWFDIGYSAAFEQLPRHLSPHRWRDIGIVEGVAEFVGLGSDPPHPVLVLTPERPATVRLHGLSFPGCNLVEIGLTLLRNPAQAVRFLVELRPLEGMAGDPQSFSRLLGGTTDACHFDLALPAAGKLFDLQLSAELVEGAGPAFVEWTSISGLRLSESQRQHFQRIPAEALPPTTPENLLWEKICAPPPLPAIMYSGVEIDHVLRSADGAYAHIDITVYDLNVGDDFHPALRFKFLNAAQSPSLEFRRLPDWPGGFDIWPGVKVDSYGPFFHLHPRPEELDRLLADVSARDARKIQAVVLALPQIIASALDDPRLADEDGGPWRAAAAQFSELGQATRQ